MTNSIPEATPEFNQELHLFSDVDQGEDSLHHTLGTSHNQAARGDHTHAPVTPPGPTGPTYLAGKLAANIASIAGSTWTEIFSVPNIPVGLWLLNVNYMVNSYNGATWHAGKLIVQSGTIDILSTAGADVYGYSSTINFSSLLNVTAVGKISLQYVSAVNRTMYATSQQFAVPQASGYSLVKIG